MPDGRDARGGGIGALLRALADDSAALVRGEATLARIELTDAARGITRGTFLIAVGSVLLFLGALALVTGIVLLVGDQWVPHDLYWLGALAVLLASGVVAVVLARRGAALLSPTALAPDQTLETLQEDKEWLKRRMTSGATSS